MRTDLQIPKELSHLKKDDRGYPIPYFAMTIDGKPEFRFIDPKRQEDIINRRVCHICGKKLHKDYCYFVSGIQGMTNCVSSDAAMHRVCAEFSLQVCPYLFFLKAERNERDELGKLVNAVADIQGSPVIREKPTTIYLIKAHTNFNTFRHIDNHLYIRYKLHSWEAYGYKDNRLTKQQSNHEK